MHAAIKHELFELLYIPYFIVSLDFTIAVYIAWLPIFNYILCMTIIFIQMNF